MAQLVKALGTELEDLHPLPGIRMGEKKKEQSPTSSPPTDISIQGICTPSQLCVYVCVHACINT